MVVPWRRSVDLWSLRCPDLSVPHARGYTSHDVQLMRDIYECALLYLGVALRHPGAQALCVQLGMPGQRRSFTTPVPETLTPSPESHGCPPFSSLTFQYRVAVGL